MPVSAADVLERFALFAGLSDCGCTEADLPYCESAAAEIERNERETCGAGAAEGLVSAAAALAFYRFALARAGGELGFSAGDVKIAPNPSAVSAARNLWREMLAAAAPYLKDAGFTFGRTV